MPFGAPLGSLCQFFASCDSAGASYYTLFVQRTSTCPSSSIHPTAFPRAFRCSPGIVVSVSTLASYDSVGTSYYIFFVHMQDFNMSFMFHSPCGLSLYPSVFPWDRCLNFVCHTIPLEPRIISFSFTRRTSTCPSSSIHLHIGRFRALNQ